MVVRRESTGNAERLEASIRELDRKVVKVGYFETARYPDGTPVAGVAVVQEFGSVSQGIPLRPTFGPAINGSKQMQRDAIAAAVRRSVSGSQTVSTGLEQLGGAMVGEIQEAIADLTSPPLSPITIARKGNDKPLVDTGLMLQSVTYTVENK